MKFHVFKAKVKVDSSLVRKRSKHQDAGESCWINVINHYHRFVHFICLELHICLGIHYLIVLLVTVMCEYFKDTSRYEYLIYLAVLKENEWNPSRTPGIISSRHYNKVIFFFFFFFYGTGVKVEIGCFITHWRAYTSHHIQSWIIKLIRFYNTSNMNNIGVFPFIKRKLFLIYAPINEK